MIATSSRVNARNSVRSKYGAKKSLGKTGMTGMKNPRSKEGGFTKEARAKTSAQFPKWSESRVNQSLSKQQSMAQSGTQVPRKGMNDRHSPVKNLKGVTDKLKEKQGSRGFGLFSKKAAKKSQLKINSSILKRVLTQVAKR